MPNLKRNGEPKLPTGVPKYEADERGKRRLIPKRLIAQKLGISPRCVEYTLKNALAKLKKAGVLEGFLHTVQAVADKKEYAKEYHPAVRCSSVECDKEFIALNSFGAEEDLHL